MCTDALDFLARHGGDPAIGFFHASPPCQFYSIMTNSRPGQADKYPNLIGPVRELLIATGKPYVIENVEGARAWLKDPVTLCGFQFGLPSYRLACSRSAATWCWLRPPRRRITSAHWPKPRASCSASTARTS